jgi:ceramide glucosyltransferase
LSPFLEIPVPAWQWFLLVPVVGGSVYSLACLATLAVFLLRRRRRPRRAGVRPPVTILKPLCGLEKGLEENLRSTCRQDWEELQVIFSVQDPDDPAAEVARAVQREMGEERVAVAVGAGRREPNGKIRNLLGSLPVARHDTLVISDSDVRLRPDYLEAIVPPLAADAVGCVCTFYRAVGARRWWERLELLTVNADLVPHFVFAHVTGATRFVLGASTALRRSTLEAIGGLAALGDYLVEDFEMGRRILAAGRRIVLVPYFVDTLVDLAGPRQWWGHQVYWDQNNRAAKPWGLFATVLLKAVPFALLFAAARLLDPLGLAVLGGALALRLAASAAFLAGIGDGVGLRSLWLLPVRDVAALVSWVLAFTRPIVVWRGAEFVLGRDGRMVPREPAP